MVADHQGSRRQARMSGARNPVGTTPPPVSRPRTSNGHKMRIHNLYADENGETHFRDIDIELTDTGPDGTISRIFPATGIIFRTTPADWRFDWHATTRRQYVVNLDAPHQVTASDGET